MRFFQNTNYDFVAARKVGYVVTAVLLLVALLSILIRGLQYGIDFKGGTEIQLRFTSAVEVSEVRRAMDFAGVKAEIKRFGADTEILVRTDVEMETTALEEAVMGGLKEILPDNPATIDRNDVIGPKIAEDMKAGAVYAILGSLLLILAYISIRFEFKFAVAAIFATFHDVVVVLGLFSLLYGLFPGLNLEIDQTIISRARRHADHRHRPA